MLTAVKRNNKIMAKNKTTLKDLIDELLEYGECAAIISFLKEGSESLSYQDLSGNIRQLAAGLRKAGLRKGDRAIVMAVNSASWITNCLAIIYSGATAVPIDSQLNDEVLKHIISDCAAKWVFADTHAEDRLKQLSLVEDLKIVNLDDKESKSHWSKMLEKKMCVSTATNGNEIALIFYTSGTSGLPKGVPLSHENILSQLDSAIIKTKIVAAGDRLLLPLPLYHVYPLNIGLLAGLSQGLPLILPYSLTGPELLRALSESKATVLVGVPRLLRSLYSGIESRFHSNKFAGAAFDGAVTLCAGWQKLTRIKLGKWLFHGLHQRFSPSLRLLTSGGALLEEDLSRKLQALGWDIAVGYGLTETAPLLCMRMPSEADLGSVGRPISGVEIRISKEKDSKGREDEGEIEARGKNVFESYLNRPKETKAAFKEDGWFRTGDLGYFKNGCLHVTGRVSSTLVMEGGKKLQPEDLEKEYEAAEKIKEIGILQQKHKLVAVVVPEPGQAKEPKKLHELIGKELASVSSKFPSYKKLSGFIVSTQPLPRTNLGKIKRQELKDRFEKGESNTENSQKKGKELSIEELSQEDQALLSDAQVAAAWEWLKKHFPGETLSLDTSPQLELNVDSFEWLNLSLDLQESLQIELSDESIARISTLRDLLTEIKENSTDKSKSHGSPLEEPEKFLSEDQKKWLKPLNPAQQKLSRSIYGLNKFLMQTFFHVKAVGAENLKADQFVLIPNHASYLDIFALCSVLPYDLLAKTQIAGWTGIAFANPFNMFMSRLMQAIPIEATHSLMSSFALGAAVLKNKRNLIWFPEGERTLNGQLLPFKQGIGLILEKSRVKAVPVYLKGTRQALPPGAFFPNFKQPITVIFGSAVSTRALIAEGKGKGNAEKIATALHDEVDLLSKGIF